jgi:S1-C subfamily serine protease
LDGGGLSCASLADEAKPKRRASLGAETRTLTADEAKAYGVTRLVGCRNGLFFKAVEKGGPADKAGLGEGDVLLALDANKLFSRDDLADFLRVSEPGTEVVALVKRAPTFKEEKVAVRLGAGPEVRGKGITWQYAGLSQLDSALATAKKNKSLLLIGLSGSDT